jgi:hypothetical protein
MSILDQHIQCQISDLSEACERYWELRGIAQHDRKEMQMELEQHFIQAALDGKSLEVVVGSNPAAFANAWAREMHPRILRGGGVILPGLIYALSVVSTTALFQQVFARTPSFTLTLFMAYVLISSGLLALLIPLSGFLAPRIKTRLGRATLLGSALVLAGLALRGAGMRVDWSMALLSWRWPLTLLLFALTTVLWCLEAWRRTFYKRLSSDRRLPLWHSVITFAGSVTLFDLFLGGSSIAVFSVCTLVGKVI